MLGDGYLGLCVSRLLKLSPFPSSFFFLQLSETLNSFSLFEKHRLRFEQRRGTNTKALCGNFCFKYSFCVLFCGALQTSNLLFVSGSSSWPLLPAQEAPLSGLHGRFQWCVGESGEGSVHSGRLEASVGHMRLGVTGVDSSWPFRPSGAACD